MAASDLCLGRGIVTIDAADIGLVSSFVLRHEIESVGIATLDPEHIGGTAEIARRTRVFVDFTLHELTVANRALIWNVAAQAVPVALVLTIGNKLNPACETDKHQFTVPQFIILPASATQMLQRDLQDTAVPITGEALRPVGQTDWYTCQFLGG